MAHVGAPTLLRLPARALHAFSNHETLTWARSCFASMSTYACPGGTHTCSATINTSRLEQQIRAYRKVVKRPAPRGRPLQRPGSVVQTVQVLESCCCCLMSCHNVATARDPATHCTTSHSAQVSETWLKAFHLPDIVLNRQIELGDLLLGFEQQRQMSLQTPSGELLLALAEEPGGLFSGVLLRQVFESTRAFTINVYALDNPSQPHGVCPSRDTTCNQHALLITSAQELVHCSIVSDQARIPMVQPNGMALSRNSGE